MAGKITVNGVTYESVDEMPREVRQIYEQTLARLPQLMNPGGDGTTRIRQREGFSIGESTTIQRTFDVDGKTYHGLESMPPDVRQAWEQMKHAAEAGEPTPKNEIKMWVQITGPGGFRKSFGTPSARSGQPHAVEAAPEPIRLTSVAIEPTSTESAVRTAIIIGGLVILGLAILAWLR